MGKFQLNAQIHVKYSGLRQEPMGYMRLSIEAEERAPRFQSQTQPQTLSQRWANVSTMSAVSSHSWEYCKAEMTGNSTSSQW